MASIRIIPSTSGAPLRPPATGKRTPQPQQFAQEGRDHDFTGRFQPHARAIGEPCLILSGIRVILRHTQLWLRALSLPSSIERPSSLIR